MGLDLVEKMLRDAEKALLSQISDDNPSLSYHARGKMLALAKMTRDLAEQTASLIHDVPECRSATYNDGALPSLVPLGEIQAEDLPTYFIHDNFLFKVGLRTRSDDSLTYFKRVRMQDVRACLDTISQIYSAQSPVITVNDLVKQGITRSNAQVILMALVYAELAQTAGRGKYEIPSEPATWERELRRLPSYPQLLEEGFSF